MNFTITDFVIFYFLLYGFVSALMYLVILSEDNIDGILFEEKPILELYETTKMNIFGCFMCFILTCVLCPLIGFVGIIVRFFYFVFHIGRKNK